MDGLPPVQLPTPEQQLVEEVHGWPSPESTHWPGSQALVSKPQLPSQARVPPTKPWLTQVSPPKSVPSQFSEHWMVVSLSLVSLLLLWRAYVLPVI